MKTKRILGLLLIAAMCVSMVACGSKKFAGIAEAGEDFSTFRLGDSYETVMAESKGNEFSDFSPEQITGLPQLGAADAEYVKKNEMRVCMCREGKIMGYKGEIVYAFTHDQLSMCIIGFTEVEDHQKFYDEIVEYYDNKCGEPTNTNTQSRMYKDGRHNVIVSYDGSTNIGITVLDISKLQ